MATRYAKRIGGTQGSYTLTLTSQGTQLSQAFLDLPRGSLEVRLLWNITRRPATAGARPGLELGLRG